MANGANLNGLVGGFATGSQRTLIIKKPASATIYYIFTACQGTSTPVPITPGLYYSVVDMSLAGGNGSVTVKNASLTAGQLDVIQNLTATRHCNGTDIWLVGRDSYLSYAAPGVAMNNSFHSFLITAAGVSTTNVVSTPLTYTGYPVWSSAMKLSPDGNKLGVALQFYSSPTSTQTTNCFELYDFDKSTGIVSNPLVLMTGTTYNGTAYTDDAFAYGCEFSPDCSKFYGSKWYTHLGSIYQWDLCAGSPAAIAASVYTVAVNPLIANIGYPCDMQLAPDGKIYIAHAQVDSMDVINAPNAMGSACSYSAGYQSISPAYDARGLPNFMTSYFAPHLPPATPFTYTPGCQSASFQTIYSPTTAVPGCAFTGYSLSGMQWDFGDAASGAANTSTLSNPVHAFTHLGTYTTELVLQYSCGGGTDTLRQTVYVQPCITVNRTAITCASLGSATVSTQSTGVFSYTWIPTAQTGSVATALSPGTYTVYIFDAASNSTFTKTATLSPLVPLTGNIYNSSSVTCNGAATGTAAVINLTGGSGNQSYIWSDGISTYTTSSPGTLSAGLWSVAVTDALTGCQINQQFFISQPPAVTVTPSASSSSACVTASLVLTGTASGGIPAYLNSNYTYSWTAGLSGTTQTASQSLAGIYVYTLTAQDSLGCSGSQSIAVNFVPNPTLTVSDVSICPLQTGTLLAMGASSYTWGTGASGSMFTDNPISSQQYAVTGASVGCSSTASASIYVMPVPLPVFSCNSPVCEGGSLTLSCNSGMAYLWSGPNSFTAAIPDPTVGSAALAAGGIYNVTVTAANSCTAGTSGTVIINPLPTLAIGPASSSICANTTSVTLIASGTATLFSWLPNQSISSDTGSTVNAYPSVTQTYTLTGSLNSCTSSATATVNVVPPLMPIASLSSPSTCAEAFNGSANTITLTAGGAGSYTITTPNDIYNSNPAGPITNLNTLPPHVPGVSTATLYGSNGVCTLSTTVSFTIVPNPTVSVSNPTPVICAGETYTYTSSGAGSYTWNSGTPGQTLYTTGNVAVSSPTTSAMFSVFGGSLGCNSPLQSVSITMNPLPIVSIQPDPAQICLNSAITLTASGTGTAYQWAPYAWINTDQGSTVSVNPPVQQSYTVVSSLNSCTASAVITVSVLPLPGLTITSNSQNVLCLNTPFTLLGSGGFNYSWQFPNHLLASGLSVQINPDNISYSGNYTLTATGANGCSNTAVSSITIENNPSGYLQSNDLNGCVPFCGNYQFVASNYSPSEVIISSWQINDFSLPANNSFNYCFTKAGDYIIKGTLITIHGCVNTVTTFVNAYAKPEADFIFAPEKPVENFDAVSFTSVNTAASQTITDFNWYFINNNYHSSNPTPNYIFENAGTYPVALIVRNQWGCIDSTVKVITIEPDFAVYIPDAFTPNEDNRNDLFYPVTRGVQQFGFAIFDRWGEKIFSTTNPTTGWDGTFKGQPCKEDVYVWKLEATGGNHETKKLTGFVTLYR